MGGGLGIRKPRYRGKSGSSARVRTSVYQENHDTGEVWEERGRDCESTIQVGNVGGVRSSLNSASRSAAPQMDFQLQTGLSYLDFDAFCIL